MQHETTPNATPIPPMTETNGIPTIGREHFLAAAANREARQAQQDADDRAALDAAADALDAMRAAPAADDAPYAPPVQWYSVHHPAAPEGSREYWTLAFSVLNAVTAFGAALAREGTPGAVLIPDTTTERRYFLDTPAAVDTVDQLWIATMSYGLDKYQGWANRYTWCVNLWLGNDPDTYNLARDAARQPAPVVPVQHALRCLVASDWNRWASLDTEALAVKARKTAQAGILLDCIPDDDSWDRWTVAERVCCIAYILDRIDWEEVRGHLIDE